MEKEDILHLANLARIRISDDEADTLKKDIEAVISYVSVINDTVADLNLTKKVGARYNVFREDVVSVEGGAYTEAFLEGAPSRKERYLKVKKILQID